MAADLIQIVIYCVLFTGLAIPLGHYMARVFDTARPLQVPVLAHIERGIYWVSGVDPAKGQHWTRYAGVALGYNLIGFLVLYALLRFQHVLPFNTQDMAAVGPDLAFNTAVSFMTNTNWQSYGGESTLSYFSQMMGLTVQNFVSAATGIAIGVAVIRGFAGRATATIGNFYADLTKAVVHILLPLSLIAALLLVAQGLPQNFSAYVTATTLEGAQQTIAQGPAASQLAIKQLGTSGGGFFNANAAHPYENPTAISNLLQCVYLLLIGAAFCFMFGRMVKDARQGRAIFAAMFIMFLIGLLPVYGLELAGNPIHGAAGVAATGNMEGKEVRFGIVNSAIWATATTAASNGSVNAMHDSLTPLAGLVTMLNIQLGEVVFGGVGSGFYGILLYVILTVFMAGLMVGRTPEYLGKKIGSREVTLAILAFLATPIVVLGFGGLSALLPLSLSSVQDAGPHGLSEILYNYSSAVGNNGSAFAGMNANVPYHNTMLGLGMLIGRFAVIVPLLAIAGGLGIKNFVPPSAGTFPTHGLMFVTLLVGVILIMGALTFFPALALGPIAEHLGMLNAQTY